MNKSYYRRKRRCSNLPGPYPMGRYTRVPSDSNCNWRRTHLAQKTSISRGRRTPVSLHDAPDRADFAVCDLLVHPLVKIGTRLYSSFLCSNPRFIHPGVPRITFLSDAGDRQWIYIGRCKWPMNLTRRYPVKYYN